MIKKVATFLVCVFLGMGLASARTTVSRNANDLPAKARTMLAANFGKTGINHIKIEHKTFGGREYDVILNDGTEVEFNSDGEWTEVDCGSRAVPAKLILPDIARYVKKNYPSSTIVQIEVDRKSYKIELDNGIDLKFGRDGRFLKID